MSPEPTDEPLAREFAKLRAADADKVPPFEPMWRPRAKRLSPWWLVAPVAAAIPVLAAAAAMILWVSRPLQEARPAAAAAVGAGPVAVQAFDPEPLEFLLDSPVLGSAPDFDTNPIATTNP